MGQIKNIKLHIVTDIKMNLKPHSIMFFTLLLAASIHSALSTPEPHAFPVAATFKASLITTEKSHVCPNCIFKGRHHINSHPDKMYGHVAWVYGPIDKPEKKFNFKNVFLGNVQEMYIMHSGKDARANDTECVKVKPYPRPIFDYNWNKNAVFEGVEWFHGTYCNRFGNVYPYWVQGDQQKVTYYEGVFDELPRGYKNDIEDMWFDWGNTIDVPSDKWFTNVLNVDCVDYNNNNNNNNN